MTTKLLFLTLSTFFLFLVSCNQEQSGKSTESQPTTFEGTVSIDGSSTVYPISEAVAEEYLTINNKARVTVGESGTGGGFKKFGRGETDLSDASRPIKQSEIDLCESNGISYLELLVAYDGMAVVVNPNNNWVNDITVEELKKIWEPAAQGVITKWNQIRPEWPNKEIHLFGPGTASGTFDYFTEVINGKAQSCRGDFTASEDDNVLVQGVAGDELALGFFGLSYYENNKAKLKLVAVDDNNDENGVGPILPSLETVKNKTYTPLSRPLFLYVNSKAAEKEIVQDFVRFYLENTVKLSKEVGYVPLSNDEVEMFKTKWSDFVNTHSKSK